MKLQRCALAIGDRCKKISGKYLVTETVLPIMNKHVSVRYHSRKVCEEDLHALLNQSLMVPYALQKQFVEISLLVEARIFCSRVNFHVDH